MCIRTPVGMKGKASMGSGGDVGVGDLWSL